MTTFLERLFKQEINLMKELKEQEKIRKIDAGLDRELARWRKCGK